LHQLLMLDFNRGLQIILTTALNLVEICHAQLN
jgi:hypothetical protein